MRRSPFVLSALLVVLPLVSPLVRPDGPPAAPVPHPHFRKEVKVQVKGLTMVVSHITVPYNADKAAAVKPGQVWFLGGAQLHFDKAVKIGGQELEPGRYALKARKVDKDHWELVVDTDGSPRQKVSEEGHALKTDYNDQSMSFEHLSIDIQPAGDKAHTKLYLDVRFGRQLARTEIELGS